MISISFLVLCIAVTSFAAPVPPSPDGIAATTVVSECTTRSLYNIIWGCLVTLFACAWSAYHPNVPRSDGGKDNFFDSVPDFASPWHRPFWLCIAIIAPEVIVFIAWAEYLDAKTLVIESPANYKITMVHAFFVKMNGFVESDGQIFDADDPEDFVRVAAVATEDIMDKSKSDGLKKLLLTGQIVWFIIQFIARFSQGTKGTTHLEVLTVAIAALSCITSVLWWNKPLDVHRPLILPPAPKNDQEPQDTSFPDLDVDDPVDIVPSHRVERRTELCTRMLHLHARIIRLEERMKEVLSDAIFGLEERIIAVLSDNAFQTVSFAFIATLFSGIHCLAWNYSFPTVVDVWLRRGMSLSIVVLGWLFVLIGPLNNEDITV